jgi:hypothetical protein
MGEKTHVVRVNRAPVLTLWAAVVAERLGYGRETALTLGRAVAGLNAQSKGRRLGLLREPEPGAKKKPSRELPSVSQVLLLGRSVPVVETPEGLRAVSNDCSLQPDSVERYLEQKFGEGLGDVRGAMHDLADSFDPDALARTAYSLYERFRPQIPEGQRGWGASGALDLDLIRSLARRGSAK